MKILTAINKKSDLAYLNKLVDEQSKTYHHFIGKKPDADYLVLTKEIEINRKSHKFKFGDTVRILLGKKILLAKVTLKIG